MCAGVQLTGSPLSFLSSPGILFASILFLKPYVISFGHPNPGSLSPPPPRSSRIRVSYAPRRLRKPPSSWMRPSRHAAPADPVQMRKSDATPTCCLRCTFTSTAWRRAAKEEVSTIRLLHLQLCSSVPTNMVIVQFHSTFTHILAYVSNMST